jgi:hypothetical protein
LRRQAFGYGIRYLRTYSLISGIPAGRNDEEHEPIHASDHSAGDIKRLDGDAEAAIIRRPINAYCCYRRAKQQCGNRRSQRDPSKRHTTYHRQSESRPASKQTIACHVLRDDTTRWQTSANVHALFHPHRVKKLALRRGQPPSHCQSRYQRLFCGCSRGRLWT